MKKLLFLFMFLCLGVQAKDFNSYCVNYSPNKTFSGVLSSIFGLNTLSRNAIEAGVEHVLKKETSSKFKVKINSFWGVNLLNGEFSSFQASAKKYANNGIFASNILIETMCPYNKITYKDNNLIFNYDTILKYNLKITEADINNIIKNSGYQKFIDNISATDLLKIQNTSVQILDNKLVLNYKIKTIGISTNLSLNSKLKITDNKLQFCDISLNSKKIASAKYLGFLNKLTNFQIDLNKTSKAKVYLENVNIENSNINLAGVLVIPKSS